MKEYDLTQLTNEELLKILDTLDAFLAFLDKESTKEIEIQEEGDQNA